MTDHNDSRARRSNGPLRRANYAKINWSKREPGPSPARKAQIERFVLAMHSRVPGALADALGEPLED